MDLVIYAGFFADLIAVLLAPDGRVGSRRDTGKQNRNCICRDRGQSHAALRPRPRRAGQDGVLCEDYVQGFGNVCFDGDIGDFNPTLQYTGGES